MPRKRSLLLLVAIMILPILANAQPIQVDGGQISGTTEHDVQTFKGIPYAAPPVGPLRWQPPQPVEDWDGVRACTEFGFQCPQPDYAKSSFYWSEPQPKSEDCLTLNIWTTDTDSRADRPVMVWIHGGNLTRGTGASQRFNGASLAKKGVVLITINYRLGPLGYLAHPELTKESEHGSSGNYGVLDQIAALQWVQRNIKSFGGDPDRVTIFGESAGAWSVNALHATPLAKGLFHRAIGESGALFAPMAHLDTSPGEIPSAHAMGLNLAKACGAETLAELRQVPVEQLLENTRGFRNRPNVDGWVLPQEIRTIFANGNQNNVPVIVGSNANEMASLIPASSLPKTMEALSERVNGSYGDLAPEFHKAYPATTEAEIGAAYLDSYTDSVFTLGMRTWARQTSAAKSNAYHYYFTHVPPIPNSEYLGAFHAAEIPYVFNNLHLSLRLPPDQFKPADQALATIMSDYWVAFAKTGTPQVEGLPPWKPYTQDTEPYMDFSPTPTLRHHLLKEKLDFMEKASTD